MAPAESEENETPEMKIAFKECRHWKVGGPTWGLRLNPAVTIASTIIIWVFVILCVALPDDMQRAMNAVAFGWIPEVWTWFYIVSQNIWIVLLVFLMVVSKYGNIKLGKDDEKPEYSFATWFSMLFSAGVAVGLFYYSVAEPVSHYTAASRFTSTGKGYGNDNEDAIHAIMVSWFHWGLHGWIPYTTMGAVLAIMSHRRGFPMTIRYCFWPLIGKRCYTWIGDVIDTLSIMTTIFGVCTSLGLGAMQINQGLQRLNHGFYRGTNYAIPDEARYSTPDCGGTGKTCLPGKEAYGIQNNVTTQIIIIIVVTLAATTSVISGVNRGIVNLSRVNFALGMSLCLAVLFLGETYFTLDVITQTFGYYIWYLPKIAFQTDAFERLGAKDLGLGGAPDGLGGSASWLGGWTIFYWGWWISWAPFVGTFLAKISKGRTLRQFIFGTLVIPSVYSFFWFGVFGAEGIRMQQLAQGSKVCAATALQDTNLCTGDGGGKASTCVAYSSQYSDEYKEQNQMGWTPPCVLDPNYHDGFGKCKEEIWNRYVKVGNECVKTSSLVAVPCGGGADPTALTAPPTEGPCVGYITQNSLEVSNGARMFNLYPAALQPASCFVPAQDNIVCLSSQGITDIFFDQLSTYGPRGFSDLLSVIGLIALVLYFVTSSDSGSLVVDIISANGHHDPPVPQRIFWALTEGATACALLASGRNLPNSDGSLKALQSASMVMGLPYTFVLFWCAHALYLLCQEEANVISKDRKGFKTFILSFSRPKQLLKATFLPGFGIADAIKEVDGWPCGPKLATGIFQFVYLMIIVLLFLTIALYQWCIMALVVYLTWATLLGFLRTGFREKYEIKHGDLLTDLICAIFVPMFTISQMQDEIKAAKAGGRIEDVAAGCNILGSSVVGNPTVEDKVVEDVDL